MYQERQFKTSAVLLGATSSPKNLMIVLLMTERIYREGLFSSCSKDLHVPWLETEVLKQSIQSQPGLNISRMWMTNELSGDTNFFSATDVSSDFNLLVASLPKTEAGLT